MGDESKEALRARARAVKKLTGISYQFCLETLRRHGAFVSPKYQLARDRLVVKREFNRALAKKEGRDD